MGRSMLRPYKGQGEKRKARAKPRSMLRHYKG